jgi:hypothetical protein
VTKVVDGCGEKAPCAASWVEHSVVFFEIGVDAVHHELRESVGGVELRRCAGRLAAARTRRQDGRAF